MSHSMETQMALLVQEVGQVKEMLQRIETRQSTQDAKLSDLDKKQTLLSAGVTNVQNQLNEHTPTINEMITIRTKVQGAGALGRVLWTIGGVLLGGAVTLVAFLVNLGKITGGSSN